MLDSTPMVDSLISDAFTAHAALRLTCNHSGYEPLWREQVGDAWREEGKEPFSWPVLAGDDERWEVRAAIDAVVADAYGLSRDQYEHVLSTFSQKSYPKAPQLCLAKFDELKKIGLDAFTRKYDPYHDIPLNENLPPTGNRPADPGGERGETRKAVLTRRFAVTPLLWITCDVLAGATSAVENRSFDGWTPEVY
jgi:hypothetical protein